MTEARAWIIKYLIEASVELIVGLDIKRGMNEIRLNSNPAQIENQASEDKTKKVLKIRFIMKKDWKGNINIIIKV